MKTFKQWMDANAIIIYMSPIHSLPCDKEEQAFHVLLVKLMPQLSSNYDCN